MGLGRILAGSGMVVGRVLGILFSGMILQWRLHPKDLKTIRGNLGLKGILSTASRHRSFPLYLCGSLVLAQFAYWAPAYLLAIYYEPNVVGSYALIVRVISAPMQFIGDAFQKVLFQRAAEETFQQGAPAASIVGTLAALLALAAIPSMLLGMFGRPLFEWAFGKPWALAGDMASWLAPVVFLNVVVCPLQPIFSVLGKQNALFGLQVAKIALAGLSVVAAGYMHANVRTAILGYSAGQSTVFILTLLVVLRYSGMGPRTAAQRLGKVYLGIFLKAS